MGNPDQLLSPDDANTGSSGRRSRLSKLNPFSSSRRSSVSSRTSSNGDDSAPPSPVASISGFSPGRRLSNRSNQDSQQSAAPEDEHGSAFRSPLMNPSPATRRPRPQTPPPAYSQNATSASGPTLGASPAYEGSSSQQQQARTTTASTRGGSSTAPVPAEDRYAFLSQFDTVFLIDDSGSMAGRSWRETRLALSAIVPICTARDEDGVDVYFLNHESAERRDEGGSAGTGYRDVRTPEAVDALFQRVEDGRLGPSTLTGMRLQRILQTYLRHYQRRAREVGDSGDPDVRPINIIVVTDGVPHDDPGAVIERAAAQLDRLDAPPYQVGIQFFQVGNEPGAAEALRRLDDDLKGRAVAAGGTLRDMVDTVTFDATDGTGAPALTSEGILKTVLGAVNRRIDNQPTRVRDS
ncbi:hypothetical protein DL764_008734 [Monosporascus ibericus]|uniref:VWFA domain-containing protein n=1 Tax=Monosporascus ibericus TaxID=155417 RepID=A0A4Q4SWT4_9PEZI|nr:hypothetical protein DL764_008734 [Monosporascus ibericus]